MFRVDVTNASKQDEGRYKLMFGNNTDPMCNLLVNINGKNYCCLLWEKWASNLFNSMYRGSGLRRSRRGNIEIDFDIVYHASFSCHNRKQKAELTSLTRNADTNDDRT